MNITKAEWKNDKEEFVYVLAAPDGTPNEITVNVALKNNGLDQKLTDKNVSHESEE